MEAWQRFLTGDTLEHRHGASENGGEASSSSDELEIHGQSLRVSPEEMHTHRTPLRDFYVVVPILRNVNDYIALPDLSSADEYEDEVDEIDETEESSEDDIIVAPRTRPHALVLGQNSYRQESARPWTQNFVNTETIDLPSSSEEDEEGGIRRPTRRPSEHAHDSEYKDEELEDTARHSTRRPAARPQMEGFVNSATIDLSDDETSQHSRNPVQISYEANKYKRPIRTARTKVKPSLRESHSSDDEDELGSMSPAYFPQSRGVKRQRSSEAQTASVPEDPNRRTSGRRRNLKFGSLVEGDILRMEASEDEKQSAKRVRHVGPKEAFRRLSPTDPFRLRHFSVCRSCGDDEHSDRGQLVYCQGCPYVYHHGCLGTRRQREHLVTRVNDLDYVLQCRFCIGFPKKKNKLSPHTGRCVATKELGPMSKPLRTPGVATIDDVVEGKAEELYKKNNVMFRCRRCERAWKMSKLPPLKGEEGSKDNADSEEPKEIREGKEGNAENAGNEKSELKGEAKEGKEDNEDKEHPEQQYKGREGNEDKDNSAQEGEGKEDPAEEQLADKRFEEYSQKWMCKDCMQAPELDTLLAWRPVDYDNYNPEQRCGDMEEPAKEYLVKWKKMSYFKATWMPGDWVWGVATGATRNAFLKKDLNPSKTSEDALPEECFRIDIIFDVKYEDGVTRQRNYEDEMGLARYVKKAYVKYKGLPYEDTVWEEPPSPDEERRWADYLVAYEDWVRGHYVRLPEAKELRSRLAELRSRDFEKDVVRKAQPASLTGGSLLQYQMDGLNWLYYMWFKQQNAILADEMGLGKTIQVIAFVAALVDELQCWPFLVVCPNSTCANWRREFKQWAPSLRVVTYFGSSHARELSRVHELFLGESQRDLHCHVVITSYEAAIDSQTKRMFAGIPWAGLIVDEGQRLKSDKNLLYGALSSIKFPFKLLLTGTPLQNNIRELFNLLQFLDTTKDAEALAEEYEELDKEKINELHNMIRPFFLRRTKVQVLTFLPPMAQIIIPISMTVLQKKLYKSILAKNPSLIKAIFDRKAGKKLSVAERSNLNNILMQLRKCLCHPFVYSRAIEDTSVPPEVSHRNLIDASAKLKLLELLLPRLQERGHRVLLFSQFLENLDIIQDFLDGMKLMHCRLDGSLSSLQRQREIDRFNEKDSPYFAFLLSTRAGGVGINLATADTVIILDPDFNPHQDIQALSRAHRIGQKNKVLVFQLMTRATVEEKIMQIGKKKMALDHVLIERMDAEGDDEEDLEAILKHGANDVFDDKAENDIYYDNESIERLLDRSQIENTRTGEDNSAESQFSYARVWMKDKLEDSLEASESATPVDGTDVWEKILKERERAAAEAAKKIEDLGRGKRRRTNVDYSMGTHAQPVEVRSRQATPDQDDEDEFRPEKLPKSPSSSSESEGSDVEYEELKTFKRVTVAKPPTPAPAPSGPAPAPAIAPPLPVGPPVSQLPPAEGVPGPVMQPTSEAPTPFPTAAPTAAPADLAPRPPQPPQPPQPHICPACTQEHDQGYCPLKLAGVEYCALCGSAHFGQGRTCPHFRSEEHVVSLLSTLKTSVEHHGLVAEAARYLRGVLGDIRRRKKAGKPVDAGEPAPGRGKRRKTMDPSTGRAESTQSPKPAEEVDRRASMGGVREAGV